MARARLARASAPSVSSAAKRAINGRSRSIGAEKRSGVSARNAGGATIDEGAVLQRNSADSRASMRTGIQYGLVASMNRRLAVAPAQLLAHRAVAATRRGRSPGRRPRLNRNSSSPLRWRTNVSVFAGGAPSRSNSTLPIPFSLVMSMTTSPVASSMVKLSPGGSETARKRGAAAAGGAVGGAVDGGQAGQPSSEPGPRRTNRHTGCEVSVTARSTARRPCA